MQSLQVRKNLFFDTEQPLKNAQKIWPLLYGDNRVCTLYRDDEKGLKHVGLNLSNSETLIISLAISLIGMFFFHFYFKSKIFTQSANKGTFGAVEKSLQYFNVINRLCDGICARF